MDRTSLIQIESLWPDVAVPFDEIVPSGCRLSRTEDEWHSGPDAFRRRRIELMREAGAPLLDELLDEAGHDAFRHGWTPLDEGRFELENVILTLTAEDDRLGAEFLQAWPPDYGPPVETSEMFQNLVRQLLRLGADPTRLEKRVVMSPTALMTATMLDELVEMPNENTLEPRLIELGFQRESHAWISKEVTTTHAITAWVAESRTMARVRMQKVKL